MRSLVLVAIAACFLLVVGTVHADATPEELPEDVENVQKILQDAQGQQKMPSREELLGMLDHMSELSDEDRENLRKELTRDIQGEQLPTGKGSLQMHQTLLLFSLLGLLSLIFLFFGYKLYKSLTDREKQRLEKKKLKEEKRRQKTK